MHVAIVIVGFRNPGDISRCLTALAAATHADFEVVICENGGRAAYNALTSAVPESLPGGQRITVMLASANLGYAGGVNAGMKQSGLADAWWILNPDTKPEAGSLAALVGRLALGDSDAVGGVLLDENGVIQLQGGHWRVWLARAVAIGFGRTLGDPVAPAEVERQLSFISGASMLVGRRFLETAGPMREDYFLYCEEVEWCLRGARKGLKLGFAPDALVVHDHGTTTGAGGLIKTRPRMPIYLDERNKMLLTRDLFALRLPIAAPAALALLFLRYGARGAWRQLGYGVSGWWAGLRGRRGVPAWVDQTR